MGEDAGGGIGTAGSAAMDGGGAGGVAEAVDGGVAADVLGAVAGDDDATTAEGAPADVDACRLRTTHRAKPPATRITPPPSTIARNVLNFTEPPADR